MLERLGADSASSIEKLRRFSELLLQWNRKVSNLISRNDEARLVDRHIRSSLEAGAWARELHDRSWLDFGSGGGFPAIPLAIAGIGERWVLVESRRTKCLFLRRVIEQLGLAQVHVEQARLEDLVGDERYMNAFDAFTSRATLTLAPTLELASQFVHSNGHALLWKGSRREEEMASSTRWREFWSEQGQLELSDGMTFLSRFIRT